MGLEKATKAIKENKQESTAATAVADDPNDNDKQIEGSGLREDLDARLATFKNLLLNLFDDDRVGYKSADVIIKEFYDDTMRMVNRSMEEAIQKSANTNTITVNTNAPQRA